MPEANLTITTEPPDLMVEIRDVEFRVVDQGVSPRSATVEPGIYMATAIVPGAPNLTQMVKVVPPATTIHLRDSAAAAASAPTAWKKMTDAVSTEMTDAIATYIMPGMVQAVHVPKAAIVKPRRSFTPGKPFWLRFVGLRDWETSEVSDVQPSSIEYAEGKARIAVMVPGTKMLVAQIATPADGVLNLALPPAGVHPVAVTILVDTAGDQLNGTLRIQTDWANRAMDYLAHGCLAEAQSVLEKYQNPHESPWERLKHWFQSRTEDPAAGIVGRYIRLRIGQNNEAQSNLEALVDVIQAVSDGYIITAELQARAGQHVKALETLLLMRPGHLPVFTEGFSLATARLRQYGQQRFEEAVIDDAHAAKAKQLLSCLDKWSPFLKLNSVTVTFTGWDVTHPSECQPVPEENFGEGWRKVSPA